MLTRPKSVSVAIWLHVLWIVLLVVGAVIDGGKGQSRSVWVLSAGVYSGLLLWSLLARWRWAWAVNAFYFGGFALLGVLAITLAKIPVDRLWKYWPFFIVFAVYACLAITLVSGPVRRYFGSSSDEVNNAAA